MVGKKLEVRSHLLLFTCYLLLNRQAALSGRPATINNTTTVTCLYLDLMLTLSMPVFI